MRNPRSVWWPSDWKPAPDDDRAPPAEERVVLLGSLQQLFEYEVWALRRVFSALNEAGAQDSALTTFAHILNAYQLWHDRIDGVDATCSPWQHRSADECEAMLETLPLRFEATLERLTNHDLERVIRYRNTKGQEFSDTVRGILTHTLLHSAYHRGQINSAIRQGGGEPAAVDFIIFVREP